MIRHIRAWLAVFCAVVLLGSGAYALGAVTFERDTLTLNGQDGQSFFFDIEVAQTPAQLARGLMFRKNMADNAGMLFLYPEERMVAFWMKNTLIPLDIIFTDKAGVIRYIHYNAQPLDETRIRPHLPVYSALEVNAGTVDALGIEIGDRLVYQAFD